MEIEEADILIGEQKQIVAFFNKNNDLVLRQSNYPEDDVYIFINKHNIKAFLEKLNTMEMG
jgi:hypothetical protein